VYALVAIALPRHLRQLRSLTFGTVLLAAVAVAAMVVVLAGTLYPVPEPPKNWLPYLFLLYLAVAIICNRWRDWRRAGALSAGTSEAILEDEGTASNE
jgi:hypothetical protein